jgi:hypothetical protein
LRFCSVSPRFRLGLMTWRFSLLELFTFITLVSLLGYILRIPDWQQDWHLISVFWANNTLLTVVATLTFRLDTPIAGIRNVFGVGLAIGIALDAFTRFHEDLNWTVANVFHATLLWSWCTLTPLMRDGAASASEEEEQSDIGLMPE